MIHFFSYYSYDDGFQLLYVGNEADAAEKTYHLPLLQRDKDKAIENDDKNLLKEVERQEKLPRILIPTRANDCGWPVEGNTLISHGNYSLILAHLASEKYILSRRRIAGEKDIYGRPTNFLFAFLCDTQADLKKLISLASFMTQYPQMSEKALSKVLHHDPYENGLCFEQSVLQNWMAEAVSKGVKIRIKLTNGKEVHITPSYGNMLLILPDGIKAKDALDELSLGGRFLNIYSESQIQHINEPDVYQKQADTLQPYKKESHSEPRGNLFLKITGIAVAILAIGSLAYFFLHS